MELITKGWKSAKKKLNSCWDFLKVGDVCSYVVGILAAWLVYEAFTGGVEVPTEVAVAGLTWKSFGRSLGINKGNAKKEQEHEQHVANIRSLKGTSKKIFNRLRKEAYSSNMYHTPTGFQTKQEIIDSGVINPNSKGEYNITSYKGYDKFTQGQGMREQNRMYDAIFKDLEHKQKQNKRMAHQDKERAKRGAKSYEAQGAKKLTINRRSPGGNVSSGTGRYSESGRSGYDSLKLSGGSNL